MLLLGGRQWHVCAPSTGALPQMCPTICSPLATLHAWPGSGGYLALIHPMWTLVCSRCHVATAPNFLCVCPQPYLPSSRLFPVTVLPWLPVEVPRFPLRALPPASVPLFFGGLSLAGQWQWTSSGLAKPANMSTVQWGFNLIFPKGIFNPALGRRHSFRISSFLCTLHPPWCSL